LAGHNDLGRAAEDAAAALLAGQGWRVLHRNWRWRHKEIDIIAQRGGVIAFVEVRARRATGHGHPLETIGWRKRRDLERAALAFIASGRVPGAPAGYRFDVITIVTGELPEHTEDAWRL
jgi:putative endonuclease